MAGKNQVTLTFGGDADQLVREAKRAERALDGVGDASRKTTDDLDRISKKSNTLAGALASAAQNASSQAVKTGFGIGAQVAEGLGSGLKSVPLPLQAVLGAVAAAALPALGATVAAAVVGGVGAGGIIGGVALAAQDPRVQTAGKALGKQLKGEFQTAASGFVDPVLRSIDKVSAAGFADKLAPSFDKLADKVDPLVDGLLALVDNALPGLESAVDAAGPVLDVLAEALPEIGAAIGDFFESVSSNPEALATALSLFLDEVTSAIEFTGDFIEVLVDIYGAAADVAEALGFITDEEMILKKATRDSGKAIEGLSDDTEDATKAMENFDRAIRKAFGQVLGIKQATLGYEQAQDDLVEELTKGKRTLDETTQAGRDNWQAINDQARAIEDLREANVANGMTLDEANRKYDDQFSALEKTLLGLGYNKTAVEKYIAELRKVPAQAQTEIHLKGLQTALQGIKTLAGAVGAIAGYGITAALSPPGRRASGGNVMAGADYIVGENGPELLSMKSGGGGYVHSASSTASMVGSGGSPVVLEIRSGGSQMDDLLVEILQNAVRVRGGDVQLVLGASRG